MDLSTISPTPEQVTEIAATAQARMPWTCPRCGHTSCALTFEETLQFAAAHDAAMHGR